LENLKFFHMGKINIAGRQIRTLGHNFAGAAGLEIWGPWEDMTEVKAAIVEAGMEFGLRLVGGRAYGTVAPEAGWIPSPLQAVYSGSKTRAYREWLPGNAFEANASIGGSFVSRNIEDYYLSPWDLDYGRFVKFDHDFIGREALEKRAGDTHRRKVTLEWHPEDVLDVYRSQLHPGANGKFMEFPCAHYSAHPYDMVMQGGRLMGFSTYPCYLAMERRWISLAVVDPSVADGSSASVIWGEPNGGSKKPGVERHSQKEIRTSVAPWPYVQFARENIRPARKQ
jgi:vanillate/3-O-methylgallate O-demethylase